MHPFQTPLPYQKNHNPEIQYALYKYLNTYKGTDNFKIDAQKEFLKNKKFHEQKVQEKYQEWLQDDEDTKYSDAKKWYINNIAFSFAEQQSEIWLQKAIAQNNPDALYVFANRELKKLKEGKTCDINYVKELFEKAMVFGSLEAAEFLISAYLTGNDGFPKTKIRANELISVFDTNEYKFYLSEDKAYCDIEKIDKILVNNNLLCNRMVELYDQMALIKEQLDKMIKEGKTYYKGYKLRGEIGFYHEYEKKSEDEDEEYYEADCDWKLVFEDNKPLPNKIDVLGFWTNNNFGELKKCCLSIVLDIGCLSVALEPRTHGEDESVVAPTLKVEVLAVGVWLVVDHNISPIAQLPQRVDALQILLNGGGVVGQHKHNGVVAVRLRLAYLGKHLQLWQHLLFILVSVPSKVYLLDLNLVQERNVRLCGEPYIKTLIDVHRSLALN